MSKGKIFIINKRVILDFKMCISEYLVLMSIVKSERKFRTMHKGTRIRYSEIKGIDIANELLSCLNFFINFFKQSLSN